VALKVEIGIVKEVALGGIVKVLMVGLVVSGKVIVTVSLKAAETLAAASFTQAYKVLIPALAKVYAFGTILTQEPRLGAGAEADSVNK